MESDDRTTGGLAGAPISWGVCEVPGWGTMLPPERVFGEMAQLGLRATELGPVDDYLPLNPVGIRAALEPHGLRLLGGFVPLVLHEASVQPALEQARPIAEAMAAAGADTFVLAIVADADWSAPPKLDEAAWRRLVAHTEAVAELTAGLGLRTVIHPHQGTLVEQADDIERLATSTDVAWCLDPGHLGLGGYDARDFLKRHGDRVGHVHLKDVDLEVADRLNRGELTLMAAVQQGLFRPLGQGDAHIGELVGLLQEHGYDGWLVLEQDCAITGAEPAPGEGPYRDAAASLEFLASLGVKP